MEYRQLGNAGVRVSVVGLGANRFGWLLAFFVVRRQPGLQRQVTGPQRCPALLGPLLVAIVRQQIAAVEGESVLGTGWCQRLPRAGDSFLERV
mgnify:CR=1 FL=1